MTNLEKMLEDVDNIKVDNSEQTSTIINNAKWILKELESVSEFITDVSISSFNSEQFNYCVRIELENDPAYAEIHVRDKLFVWIEPEPSLAYSSYVGNLYTSLEEVPIDSVIEAILNPPKEC